jgi:hypothetical protein
MKLAILTAIALAAIVVMGHLPRVARDNISDYRISVVSPAQGFAARNEQHWKMELIEIPKN